MANKLFTISGTSPASASTAVVGSPIVGLGGFIGFRIVSELVGATGGTLDIYLQWSPDDGTTWFDYVHFTQLAAGAAAIKYNTNSGLSLATITTVGKGTSPALAANTATGGLIGDQLRCLAVAGASTSAGAAVAITVYASAPWYR